jgi:hypothetical protein
MLADVGQAGDEAFIGWKGETYRPEDAGGAAANPQVTHAVHDVMNTHQQPSWQLKHITLVVTSLHHTTLPA